MANTRLQVLRTPPGRRLTDTGKKETAEVGEVLAIVLQELEGQGLIRLGPGHLPDDFWNMPRSEDIHGHVLSAVLEERGEGQ